MSDELFPAESVTVKSPRLRWMEKHRVQTYKSPKMADEDYPWNAWTGELDEALNADSYGSGRTEEDAVVSWALKNDVMLWHEEGLR